MMLAAYLLFAMIDTSVKWLALAGLPALQLAFMRYVGHFAISFAEVSRDGLGAERPGARIVGLLFLRGLCLMLATIANFYAIRYLPLPVTASILFSVPLIVTALSAPVLGERVGPWRWGSVLLGFAGVLIVMRPFGEGFHPSALVLLGGAACFAGYTLLTRRLAGRVPARTMQLYTGAVGTFALLPAAWVLWESPVSLLGWLLILSLGIWGWGGHELFSRAHRFAEAAVLTPFSYSFLLYLTLGEYIIAGALPDAPTLLGAAIIVTSGLVVWWRENHARR